MRSNLLADDLTSRLTKLGATILETARSRSDIGVLYATPTLVPTPAKVLDGLELEIGAPLPPEVRAFYQGGEQLGLVWQEGAGKETAEQPEDWAALCNDGGDFWSNNLSPSRDPSKRGGMICIPTAAEVFRKGYWLNRIVPDPDDYELKLDGDTFTEAEVYSELYPFDFITTFYCAALWHNSKRNEWRVVLGDDHGACWTGYKTMSVTEYFAELERGLGGLRTFRSSAGEEKAFWALRAE